MSQLQENKLFDKIVIAGVGLIGGSMGLAINRRRAARSVVGIDKNQKALEAAQNCGAIDSFSTDYSAVEDAEIVIIATPVGAVAEAFNEMLPYLKPGTVVTDVGSTKAALVADISGRMPRGSFFVGGHPMAGSEIEGIKGADPCLFENAYYIITPRDDTPGWCLEKVNSLVKALGASTVIMDPDRHDLAVAAVSHLPHLVAAGLVNFLFDMPGGREISALAAGGFRDSTRIAAGSPGMWSDIFLSNGDFVLKAVEQFKQQLDFFASAVAEGNRSTVHNFLGRAQANKISMQSKARGYLPPLWELVVTVQDRPGIIGELAGILGSKGINISDIDILRVREGQGGTMSIAFASQEERQRALDLLQSEGYRVEVL